MARAFSVVKDAAIAIGVVGLLLFSLYAYAGVWPPVVVVESGSMMHASVPFGRIGTIDPGDLVVVKEQSLADVETWADHAGESYGDYGDVVVYFRRGDTNTVPIIHRAMTWVDVDTSSATAKYVLTWPAGMDCGNGRRSPDGSACEYGSRGIYLPRLGFDEQEGRGFTRDAGYRPPSSGFITQGDNPITNGGSDQATGLSPSPVQPSWLQGVSRGELPWLGLMKLAVAPQLNEENPPKDWIRVWNCYAPRDLWIMLVISIAALIAVPVGIDALKDWRASRRQEKD